MDETIIKIIFTCASLSVFGSFLIITTYALSQQLKRMGAQFVFFQSICDLIFASNLLVKVYLEQKGYNQTNRHQEHGWTCEATAYVDQFFSEATIAWNFMMSVAILQTVNNAMHFRNSKVKIHFYHLFVWIVSFLNATILMYLKAYGPGIDGCWIEKNQFLHFFTIPLTVYFLGSIIILLYVVTRIRGTRNHLVRTRGDESYGLVTQVVKYIVVFIVIWSLPFSTTYLGILKIPYPLVVNQISFAFVALQGFANSVVWMTSPHLLKIFREYYQKHNELSDYSYRRFSLKDSAQS